MSLKESKIISCSMGKNTTTQEIIDFKAVLEGYFGCLFKIQIDEYTVAFVENMSLVECE